MSTSTDTKPNIAFIGGGNMASSIIGGLVHQGYSAQYISVSDPIAASRDKLAAEFGIGVTEENAQACKNADVIVLAVKPQVLKDVAATVAPAIHGESVVVSIAAGIPVTALENWLGKDTAIVRCMPNTPALVHRGASGLFANPRVNDKQKQQVEALFSAVGSASWLDREQDIDAVTALSGSGPAYFFLLMEAMENAGVELGLDRAAARSLTLQTALGAATMAASSDVDAAELRRRVTSPGGTTEQAIKRFTDGGFSSLVTEAMSAACTRAAEMAEEFSR